MLENFTGELWSCVWSLGKLLSQIKMLEAKEFKGVLKKLKTCYQTDIQHYAKKKTCVHLVYKVCNTDHHERRMFSTLSLHRSLHALHSVYGRRDKSGFSSMCRHVTISNYFSPYPSKYQTNKGHNLTCKDETSDIQKSKLKNLPSVPAWVAHMSWRGAWPREKGPHSNW